MGKSGGGKKKKGGGGSNKVTSSQNTKPIVNGGNVSDAQILLMKRVEGIKEDGNKKYQVGDYAGALEHYSKGLELIPNDHATRAVFHSNRAACLMQINPIDYEKVIAECSLALKVQPGFSRALLRRARAFEAVGKSESALEDVNAVLKQDPKNKEAAELSRQLAPEKGHVLKKKDCSHSDEVEEAEMDDWLFAFAQLFRSRLRIDDADAHLDLNDRALDLCSKALEETLTCEEAQPLFDEAAQTFQHVAALALLNWGNLIMCAAQKRAEETTPPGERYEWVKQRYNMAKEKYDQALSIKPDYHEGFRALAEQQLEMAKLNCTFALQQKVDLSVWDPTETLNLFDSAEEKIKVAVELQEKHEEEEKLDSNKKEEGDGGNGQESEMLMLWGNILYERSQLEFEIGLEEWEKNLDSALEKFKLADVSETGISGFVEQHCSNQPAAKGYEKGDEKEVTASN